MGARRGTVEWREAWIVAAAAVLAGVSAAAAGAQPTATRSVDVILVMAAVGVTVWAASAAPWWLAAVVTAVGLACSPAWPVLVLGAVTLVVAIAGGARGRSSPVARSITAAGALNVLARLGDRWSFGATAAVAVPLAVTLLIWGLLRRPRRQRRIALLLLGGTALAGVGAIVGLLVAAASSRSHLTRANDEARAAIDLLADGRFDEARTGFASANEQFALAADDLSSPWAKPAALVPVAAQYQALGEDLSATATDVTGAIVSALAAVDLDALRPTGGRIDLEALARTRQPLHDLLDRLDELDVALDQADSPWIVPAIRRRFDDLRDEIADQRERGETLTEVVDAAPALLGADGPRTYFFAFTTPSEARPLGGFMGTWAEITVTGGQISMTDFGRADDLDDANDGSATTLTGLDDFLARYADDGFALPDGGTSEDVWHQVGISPHFPYDAQVIAQLYPVSGGSQIDGVFVLDVDALVALLSLTGPVEIAGLDQPLTVDNAREYLLVDQYLAADDAGHVDALEQLAVVVVRQVLTGQLPDPTDLADLFSPLVREQRLVAWAADPAEQALFQRLRLDGGLPDRRGGDGLMVAFTNVESNRIDAFLDGEVSYDVVLDPAHGTYEATLTTELSNGAPASGLPPSVIGNASGAPDGTERLRLSLYLGAAVTSASVDGDPFELDRGTEAGYDVASAPIDLAAGEDATIVVRSSGTYDPATGYSLVVRNQAAVRPFATTVTIREGADGPPATTTITEAGVTRVAGP